MNRHTCETPLEWISPSPAETTAFGRALARWIEPGDVIALAGPLGAGKTQLIRGLASGLGAHEGDVSSPTFTLMCEYPGRFPIVHIDAYRMEGLSDLESIGWSPEMWAGAATLVEWADRIAEHLPGDHLFIQLDHVDPERRALTLQGHGAWTARETMLRRLIEDFGGEPGERTHPCPICRRLTNRGAATYPFCSERCRLVDLNRWFGGQYQIGTSLSEVEDPDDLDP